MYDNMTERDIAILGQPPRISPVSEVPEDLRGDIVPPSGYEQSGVPPLYGMLLHNPALLKVFRPLSSHFLVRGTLPLKFRELAVLRTAWLRQFPYIWGEHVLIAHRIGMTSTDIERVIEGSSGADWMEFEKAVLEATEELLAEGMISDRTWQTLEAVLNPGQLVELPVLIGQYQTLGFLMNSLRLPLVRGNLGLAAR